MKNKHFFYILVLFLHFTFIANAKEAHYYFRHINTENGLSQNTVLSILQDKTGFMWFGTKDGLNRYDGVSIKVFKQNNNNPVSIGNNTVWSLLETPDGNLWAGTDKGIYIYNPLNDSFQRMNAQTTSGETINGPVLDLKIDTSGNIYIATGDLYRYSTTTGLLEHLIYMMDDYNNKIHVMPRLISINIDNDNQVWMSILHNGIKKYNPENNDFKHFSMDSSGKSLNSSLISITENIDHNRMLIGSYNDELRIMDKSTEKITSYQLDEKTGNKLFIRDMELFSDGNCWIGTESGLYIHNCESHSTTHLFHNINDRYSLSDNAIYSLYEDREGGIWVGTYFGGVNYYPRPYSYFETVYPITGQNSITGERISGICEDSAGNIWIGTEDAGLNCWNAKTKQFTFFAPGERGLNYNNIHDIVADGDLLWIGTFSHGINVYNLKTRQWKHYLQSEREGALNNNDIFAIFKDSSGRIWIGTSSGALLYDRENDRFILLKEVKNYVSDIIEDSRGQIWFSTTDIGADCYNPHTKECKNYNYHPDNPFSICYHKLTSMYLDSQKQLWFASESKGICRFDAKNQQFTSFGEKEGFSNSVIYKILEDNDGNLWLSSNQGLMRFNPETGKIRIFTQSNGLPGNQFNYKSGYKDKNGKMYFGTVNGLVAFQPADFKINEIRPSVVITGFRLLNNEKLQTQDLSGKTAITLKHYQSSFSIDFAALSFVAPAMNSYAYKMVGLENQWNYLSSAQRITYSNLPAGEYIFKVIASNNDDLWNEEGASLTIIVLPQFWQTRWAYSLYVILALLVIFFIFRYFKQKIERRNKRNLFLFETQKEKEIYDAKIEFFTNVAHEVRTPLTLIKGPLEYIRKNDLPKDELQSNLQIMEKNTNRLLALINQLLDFRKTESKKFSLTFINVNINCLLEETYIRFRQAAEQKSLIFTLQFPHNQVFADIDKEAFTKIVSNLFTNAIKYGETFIRVTLEEAESQFFIRIQNDGQKIPDELKEKIFEPFYQIKNEENEMKSGSGIGLALVKSLVELHEGNVCLDEDDTVYNTFIIVMPKNQQQVIDLGANRQPEPNTNISTIENDDPNRPTLLVVEDDDEMRTFIVGKLETQYHLLTAKNGGEALNMLEKQIVGLIISDIMMPLMNGLELCAHIKQNQDYSHIPVILLTAMTNIQSKIDGLESGADAYIEKPFSIEHLQAQIQNLLDNRRKIRETFANSPFVHSDSIAMNKSDKQFLTKLTEVIHKNISNLDFNVDNLAEAMYMSRSSLLRKIKGISELTPNEFIRLIRLKRAAEILQAGEYKVNEVCYFVGFASNSYFTKAFQKQFGILPKNFGKEEHG